MQNSNLRKIIHIDMDAFFASVEQRDNPELRGKAIAVGGTPKRGVVCAASYEARRFGVRAAMSGNTAFQKCPHIIFVRPRFEAYKEASNQVMSIFREYTDLVEPLSLDEAYLDVTECKINDKNSATLIAKEIKRKILEQTGLTASAGVSFNKFLAKVASDYNKPNGLKVIRPEEATEFIKTLAVGKIPGVGKVTEDKMHALGFYTGADILNSKREELQNFFGKSGAYFYDILTNRYESKVEPNRIRKSVGAERTFSQNLSNEIEMVDKLKDISEKVFHYIRNKDLGGKTITLKVKYFDFVQITRSKTFTHFITDLDEIFTLSKELLQQPFLPNKPVRLLGIQLSNLNNEKPNEDNEQLSLDFYIEYDEQINEN